MSGFSHKPKIWEDDFVAAKFNLVSAGLHNYLPHIAYKEHEGIFKNILLRPGASFKDKYNMKATDEQDFYTFELSIKNQDDKMFHY